MHVRYIYIAEKYVILLKSIEECVRVCAKFQKLVDIMCSVVV
jgi:hypothetical protein